MEQTAYLRERMSPVIVIRKVLKTWIVLLLAAVSARAAVLFQSDFESETASCYNFTTGEQERSNCPTTPPYSWGRILSAPTSNDHQVLYLADGEAAHSGTHALKLVFTKIEDRGGAEPHLPASDNVTHVFTRYYEYYAPAFDFAVGMKTHRILGRIYDALDFDAITYSRSSDGGQTTESVTIENNGRQNWINGSATFSVQREQWYCVENELKLEDPVGASNGEARLWIDGQLMAEQKSVRVRDLAPKANDPRSVIDTPITTVFFGGWWSTSPSRQPSTPSARYIDDVVVATERIGCGSVPPDVLPPMARPRRLRVR